MAKAPAEPQPQYKDLNFKVEPEFHQRFKMRAVVDGLSMNELLRQSFAAYEKHSKKKRQ